MEPGYGPDMTVSNPGTRIVSKIVFPVLDMEEAQAFYRSLGFAVEGYDANYAWVTNAGDEVLHLAAADHFERGANRAAGYLHVQDAADWHTAWTEAGIAVGDLVDQPWGMREFTLIDPDGNFLRVGQNT